MFKRFDRQLKKTTRPQLVLLAVVSIGFIGLLDYLTGHEVSFSIFYLLPISLCWYAGRQLGLLFSVLSAFTWLLVDFSDVHNYSQSWIPFWNALVRFAFFYFLTTILTRVQQHVAREEVLARTDALTGLCNAREFRDRSKFLFRMANRQGQPLVLAYIDLDNFKQVNDRWGHEVGDQVLSRVGQLLQSAIRSSDLAGRLGGDEFAVLLTGTAPAEAEGYFQRLQEHLLAEMAANAWPVGFSIGVAIFAVATPDEVAALKFADQLMYQVKQAGKNLVLCAEPEL